MLSNVLKKVFGSKNDREIKKIQPVLEEINQNFEQFEKLSDEQLQAKTQEFKDRIEKGETLDELLPEAFAVVKQACKRMVGKKWMAAGNEIVWDMVPFDVQLIGGIVQHQGKISEMATGEGKTLVATMPLYLNALEGKGAHLVTVNDYLAQRDAEWMGEIFKFLGLTVGVILNQMTPAQRREAYNCDITYGTNNEFGFDYLRDNMSGAPEDIVQVRGHHYAIVDEVDSVLIDEARTPLIISGPVEHATHNYDEVKPLVDDLVRKQTRYVNALIAEAEKLMENDENNSEAGLKLLIAQRGAPKNKRLEKLYQRQGIKKLVFDIESEFIRDKRIHEVDEELFYSIEEKHHSINLTEKGRHDLSPNNPDEFVLPDLAEEFSKIEGDDSIKPEDKQIQKNEIQIEYARKNEKLHNISQLLKAYSLFEKDHEYVVQEGKVLIVDEFTGRIMYGRRYSDGLHQALEAKENVKIEGETQTLATITLQNYFRLYDKLAGMTGTAETEANEFWDIYKLDVVVIPTNKPISRQDNEDYIYRTKREKLNSVIEEISRLHHLGRPVLVGTVSVDVSETLSRMLKRQKIPHSVLNAKYHKQEAEIISKAGQPGAVTIATNMAGRGTDIKLSPQVRGNGKFAGEDGTPYGLHIIGTERHESRRIDRQLRGRSGRQGDPGATRFYLSLEDELMRLFGSDRLIKVMDRLGAEEGEVITHSMVTKAIEKAQKRVEEQNFSIRKRLLDYDDVMNKQREVVYKKRRKALLEPVSEDDLKEMIDEFLETQFEIHADEKKDIEDWDIDELNDIILRTLTVDFKSIGDEKLHSMQAEDIREYVKEEAWRLYEYKRSKVGDELLHDFQKYITLRIIDENWKDHLHQMDLLKEGIGLRAYGQKDPLIEYKREAFEMFMDMMEAINQRVLEMIWRTRFVEAPSPRRGLPSRIQLVHQDSTNMGLTQGKSDIQKAGEQRSDKPSPVRVENKVGRNDPCPCGSGKKYKKCHGANVDE
ncbi:MAG: preprotein translocase subunit SecA [Calditrichia bacterium]